VTQPCVQAKAKGASKQTDRSDLYIFVVGRKVVQVENISEAADFTAMGWVIW